MASLRNETRYFLAALQFLTRLPIPPLRGFQPEWLERGAKYFPVAGAFIGAVAAAVLEIASHLWGGALPPLLAVAAAILLTGALHEDGWADFFDAMGGATREARLTIMKDSRIGVFGALALGMGLAMKVFALAALSVPIAAAALIAAHASGRLATVAVLFIAPYAGRVLSARVKPLDGGITRSGLAAAAVFGLLPLLLLPLTVGFAGFVGGLIAAVLVGLLARLLLGGYTGDVLGAVEQGFEIAFLLGAAACA